jgi:hypothetical protein
MMVSVDGDQGLIVIRSFDACGDLILTRSQAMHLGPLLLRRAAELGPPGQTDDPRTERAR